MKQILKIILILAIIIVGCTTNIGKIEDVDSEVSQWPDYYKEIFNERCKDKPTYECCMAGLKDMVKNNYLLADENEECPEGFKANMLLCLGSLVWCEPMDYYKELAKKCEEKEGFTCCISSVNAIEEGGYKLEPETGCPEGYQVNMLRCVDSYRWCEPVE